MTDRPLPAGLVPRYLSRDEAAAYLGVSATTFDLEVRDGWWPSARRRGGKGGRLTWDRLMLDAAADRAAGLGANALPAAPEPVVSLVERLNATTPQHRPQRRAQAPR